MTKLSTAQVNHLPLPPSVALLLLFAALLLPGVIFLLVRSSTCCAYTVNRMGNCVAMIPCSENCEEKGETRGWSDSMPPFICMHFSK